MADHPPSANNPVRFGVFELDPHAGELRKHGVRIKLQDQPFAVLLVLLEKPGHIVTKEELQKRLWPADTFVEFDKGIYNAMKRLRETLGDGAETPRYIETIPKRGYRFIAPVTVDVAKEPAAVVRIAPATSEPLRTAEGPTRSTSARRLVLLLSIAGVLVFAVAVKMWLNLRSSLPRVIDSVQLTRDGLSKDFTARLLGDGTRLYFQESLAGGTALVQVSTQGGETGQIAFNLERPMAVDISPARSELLVTAGEFQGVSYERPLWVVPLPVGAPHRVGDILAHDARCAAQKFHLAPI